MMADSSEAARPRRLAYSILPAAGLVQSNSKYPRTQQDGLRWASRGLSSTLTGGATASWGPVTAAVVPSVSYQANEGFTIVRVPTPGLSPYTDFHYPGRIDLPQRFGTSAFWTVHPGQSFIRADGYGAAVGFSSENLRWGPARRNPILMSAAAPGFPHFFAGTSKPYNLRYVEVSIEAIWGHLQESDYFDDDADNDERLFAGLVASVSPAGSGLTLGIARSYLRIIPPSGLSLGEQIFGPYTGVRTNPDDEAIGDNQLVSVFMSWMLQESGFEVYGEYAREDHWEDSRDLLMELDHSRGFTFGLEKVFRMRNTDMLRVNMEATMLGMSQTWQSGRPGSTFYEHSQVVQGYTHLGQPLGAPIGPGSDAQYVSTDYITPKYLGGLYYERVRYDNDAYYRDLAEVRGYRGHDTEWTIGLRGGGNVRALQIIGDVAYSRRYNRRFVEFRNSGQPSEETNFSFTLGAAWIPGQGHNDP
jgi:hypothetical protein